MRCFLGVIAALAILSIKAQDLKEAQAVSQKLASARIPNNISAAGKVDPSIPPLLARFKHAVRAWLEAELMNAPIEADATQLQELLAARVREAGLAANDGDHELHPFGRILGVGVWAVDGEPGLLRVGVSYDSYCPPDDSVLMFQRRPDRRWQMLMNSDTTDFAHPWGDRGLLYVDVSQRDENGQFYIFLVRTRSYCPESGSRWNTIDYKVLRPTANPESPRELLDAQHSYAEDEDCRIVLQKGSLMMDFPDWGNPSTITRTHILTYAIRENDAQRTDPVAVSAEGFVEEWMASPWSFASEWTEPAQRASLESWHERLDTEKGGWPRELSDEPLRQSCSPDGKFVQISYPGGWPPEPAKAFFLVREIGPHQFRLVKITKESVQGCSEPEPDETAGDHILPESLNRRHTPTIPALP